MRPTHPQRLTAPAPPGALLKRAFGLALLRPRRIETDSDPAYLAAIRQLPCLRCTMEPCGIAAHLRMSSGAFGKKSGLGRKPSDRWSLPLCQEHHDLQHKIGELQFWHDAGISPVLTAIKLYERRDDAVAMRAVVFAAIAEKRRS
jgi:hypothetical protein